MRKFGMCFSREFEETDPLGHIGRKRPTYINLFELAHKKGWEAYAVTRRTYEGKGVFNGAWKFKDGNFEILKEKVKIDIIFDWAGDLKFPPKNEQDLKVVNIRKFKELCWNKWEMYFRLKRFMPKTFRVGDIKNEAELEKVLSNIKTDWVVVKPENGLKGRSVYVGPKENIKNFEFDPKYKNYIAQEFVDTSDGIEGITGGLHDLRVVIINGKAVWSHVRVPEKGTYKANVAQGGTLKEVNLENIPSAVKAIVSETADIFYKEFDNPIYSIDFGMENGKPYIFEVNDQIGFPLPNAKGKDNFLNELINNFESKIT